MDGPITDFLSQFEINAKMDISKNQWRSTGLNFESFLKTTIHAIHHVISKMYVYYIAV